MSKLTFSFPVDERLLEQFAAVAKLRGCATEALLVDLMHELVHRDSELQAFPNGVEAENLPLPAEIEAGYDEWIRRKVQVAIDSANAGRVVSAEEVEARFAAKRAETQRKLSDHGK
jgi:hypothetical protein